MWIFSTGDVKDVNASVHGAYCGKQVRGQKKKEMQNVTTKKEKEIREMLMVSSSCPTVKLKGMSQLAW